MPSEELIEREIIRKCQKGKLEEFTSLYDKYVKRIYNFIYYKCFHKESAEDLTSQTFIKALDKIKTFNPQRGSFSSWLYQIARNNVIDFYKKKERSTKSIYDFWGLSSEEDIAFDTEIKEKLSKVKEHLKNLKPEQREIVLMRIWDDLSYKEIARITGKSESACKMMFSRTIRELRKNIPFGLLLIIFFNF